MAMDKTLHEKIRALIDVGRFADASKCFKEALKKEDLYMPSWTAPVQPPPMPAVSPASVRAGNTQQAASTSPPVPYAIASSCGTAKSWFVENDKNPLDLLANRLRLKHERYLPGGMPPGVFMTTKLQHIHAFSDAEKVRIFYVKDGVSNTIEEEAHSFPSDGLVAQFKLLLG